MNQSLFIIGLSTGMSWYSFIWKYKRIIVLRFEGERLWPNPNRFLTTIADGIRVQQIGHITWPILLKLVEKDVFTIVSCVSLLVLSSINSILLGERLWPNPPQFIRTIADAIRSQQLGHMTWPILLKYAEKHVFTIVSLGFLCSVLSF